MRRTLVAEETAGLQKITVLVFSPPPLCQVIDHLFRGRPDFEIVGRISGLRDVGRQAGRLLPELIVASVKPVSTGICRAVSSIKQSSPASKLILICSLPDFAPVARKCGVDACLNDEELVGHLLPMAQVVVKYPRRARSGT